MKGRSLVLQKIADHARNESLASALWSRCEELTGVRYLDEDRDTLTEEDCIVDHAS